MWAVVFKLVRLRAPTEFIRLGYDDLSEALTVSPRPDPQKERGKDLRR